MVLRRLDFFLVVEEVLLRLDVFDVFDVFDVVVEVAAEVEVVVEEVLLRLDVAVVMALEEEEEEAEEEVFPAPGTISPFVSGIPSALFERKCLRTEVPEPNFVLLITIGGWTSVAD